MIFIAGKFGLPYRGKIWALKGGKTYYFEGEWD
jgi:hypothetical protein